MFTYLLRALGITLIAVAVALLVLADPSSPVTPLVVLIFVLIGPGLAIVSLLRFEDPIVTSALVVPLSLGLAVLVAEVLVYTALWSGSNTVLILVGLTIVMAFIPPRQTEPGAAA
jgi:hypothetical protein